MWCDSRVERTDRLVSTIGEECDRKEVSPDQTVAVFCDKRATLLLPDLSSETFDPHPTHPQPYVWDGRQLAKQAIGSKAEGEGRGDFPAISDSDTVGDMFVDGDP